MVLGQILDYMIVVIVVLLVVFVLCGPTIRIVARGVMRLSGRQASLLSFKNITREWPEAKVGVTKGKKKKFRLLTKSEKLSLQAKKVQLASTMVVK